MIVDERLPDAIEMDLRDLEAWIATLPMPHAGLPRLRGLRINIADALRRAAIAGSPAAPVSSTEPLGILPDDTVEAITRTLDVMEADLATASHGDKDGDLVRALTPSVRALRRTCDALFLHLRRIDESVTATMDRVAARIDAVEAYIRQELDGEDPPTPPSKH